MPVFNGEIKADFTKRGEMFRVINNLAPALNDETLSPEFGSPEQAVFAAARNINRAAAAEDVRQIAADNLKITFAKGRFDRETTAEKFYFPVAGDFDADGRADFAVFRAGAWIVNRSSGGVTTTFWGLADDKLVPADYDGDGGDDIAVYRPSNGTWYVFKLSGGATAVQFGAAGDTPAPGDFDGDGRADFAVFRDGAWYKLGTAFGFETIQFGIAGDKPVPNSYLP